MRVTFYNEITNQLISNATIYLQGDHAGNKTSHLQSMHKNHFKRMQQEINARQAAAGDAKRKRTADRPGLLNGVKMTGPALQLNCLRLVTQHRLPFKMLDYEAFQDITDGYTNAMSAKEK